MPPHNTPEERPSTPSQAYMNSQPTHPNTPASIWSSSAPPTPQSEPVQQQQQVLSQYVQVDGRTVAIYPSTTLIRRRPLQPPQREIPPPSESPHGTQADLLRSLDFISAVDENLICPICRVALINPITTVCDHVFCRDCFDLSYKISPSCPIDRCPLVLPRDLGPTHRLVLNQLDGLEVKCPNTGQGCETIFARSMVQNHVEKYCDYALVSCSEKECERKLLRKNLGGGCTHYTSTCPDCAESLLQVDMQQHRDKECSERTTNCEKCGFEILRCRITDHENDCEDALVPCRWNIYGCSHTSKRRELMDHAPRCDFKAMGPVVDILKEEISALRSEVQLLNEKDKAKDRRIKFLESDRMISSSSNAVGYPVPYVSAQSDATTSSADHAPFDSRDQYLLSLLESQESKVEQLSAGMTEIEAKQTMMLFNETIPIKEQLAELRSAQGILGMQVRWLMNFRLQERRLGAATGPSNETKPGGGPGGPEFPTMRRSSDTMRELVTKL